MPCVDEPIQAGAPPGREPLTDLGNARRLARLRGRDLRYVKAWGAWFIWDGTRWAEDVCGRIGYEAQTVVTDLLAHAGRVAQAAAQVTDPDTRDRLAAQAKAAMQWARASESRARLEAMVGLAGNQPEVAMHWAAFDADPWLLNCPNGTVDLRTGGLRPHRREDHLTKSTGVPYDPAARAPRWEVFLDRIMDGNTELIRFLRRAVGMSAAGVVRDHVLLICWGTGSNGKSTFLDAICAALGDYAMAAPPDLLMANRHEQHPTALADLFGRRLVVASESDEGRRLNEALVKRLTGGDVIKARRIREDFWSFAPTHTLWLATNHKPVVLGNDHAIWRRIQLIPFRVTIDAQHRDPELPAKLRQELPGILGWIVRGCLEWQRHGLQAPADVEQATQTYRSEMDVLAAFLEARCVVKPAARVKVKDLYEAYLHWCEETGERPLSQRIFGVHLAERGFERAKSTGGQFVWLGVGLAIGG
ncbi:MAG: DUF5906 domain-containing protein [Firmicutes bacterium]|nr:DUF5906 domain-containing protein [Bacillota bacterium]